MHSIRNHDDSIRDYDDSIRNHDDSIRNYDDVQHFPDNMVRKNHSAIRVLEKLLKYIYIHLS